jgi:hypothetical protein
MGYSFQKSKTATAEKKVSLYVRGILAGGCEKNFPHTGATKGGNLQPVRLFSR